MQEELASITGQLAAYGGLITSVLLIMFGGMLAGIMAMGS